MIEELTTIMPDNDMVKNLACVSKSCANKKMDTKRVAVKTGCTFPAAKQI
jgi:hypothetical protein